MEGECWKKQQTGHKFLYSLQSCHIKRNNKRLQLYKMLSFKSVAIGIMMLSSGTNAFSTQASPETTRLQFLKKAFTVATTAATGAAILPQSSSATSGDPFSLPSYSEAVKNKSVDMNLEEVNKKIMDDAAAKRDDRKVDQENNQRFIALRQEEAEEEKRLERMRELAKKEREERIAKEKAETKANRWNTF